MEMLVSQGWVQRAISFGEDVDVTCTGDNHPPNQASNKAKKLTIAMRNGQYRLSGSLDAIKY